MGPLFTIVARMKCRTALRQKGYSFRQINDVIVAVDDDAMSWAVAQSGADVSAIGDGTLLDKLFEWFKSPQGQAFLDALLKLLLGLLMGLEAPNVTTAENKAA
jgi:hypothetical protein